MIAQVNTPRQRQRFLNACRGKLCCGATLPLALQTISGGAAAASIGRAGAVSAATMVMTIPTVLLFTVSQRMVMETMTMSGIKG